MKNRSNPDFVVPDFTPVPRKHRVDGWTPARQRAFIAALAATGSVTAAARSINMAKEGAYMLRLHPQGASFRAAWEAALTAGLDRLRDIAIERAIDGVPVPVFYKGEQCGEKRWHNDRLLMFILRHRAPDKYGALAALPPGTRHPDTVAREGAGPEDTPAPCPVCARRKAEYQALAEPDAPMPEEMRKVLDTLFTRYAAKVRSERQLRLQGEIVAADFTLRQLTHIELILANAGMSDAMITLFTTDYGPNGRVQEFAHPMTAKLDALRRKAWAESGEPARPPLPMYARSPGTALVGGPDRDERDRARQDAERRMAEAQAEWEAAARSDSWAEWKVARGR
ncbi:hypothetical protein [Sphingomonas azotifigens]|uniref:hypothetical protein n=1 Tax=Sphingomonas azotifigens TaxID=330920 RepID=UPI000A067C05|nr:hypothetical protein [Sphingomonas azotifigens]